MWLTLTFFASYTMNNGTYTVRGATQRERTSLTPDEAEQVTHLVNATHWSRSRVIREAAVIGLPLLNQRISSPAAASLPAVAGFTGGEAPASPAAFSSDNDTAG